MKYDVVIIGGGLAGLSASLHLKKAGFSVLVIEKRPYPNHKVCGEYVSNEIKPYLDWLGVPLHTIPVAHINRLLLSTRSGRSLETRLPLGGFGISRYALDLLLYKTALEQGVEFIFEAVQDVHFEHDQFFIPLSMEKTVSTPQVIGAFGKRSNLDKRLDRDFIAQKSPWLGVKCHYEFEDFDNDLVALHHFEGGYGGLSRTENNSVNFCYLATYESFKPYKNVEDYNQQVVAKNPFLGRFLHQASAVFDDPISISQISFEKKATVENHIFMCGDSAGLIHPLCGNGMAMAIHSAKIASETIIKGTSVEAMTRPDMEQEYEKRWKRAFSRRLWMGRNLQRLLMSAKTSDFLIGKVAKSETFLQRMIQSTHGKPILV